MRFFLTLLLVLGCFSVFGGNFAHAIECDEKSPSLVVKTYKEKTKYIRDFTSQNLTQLHTGSYRANSLNVLGLGGGAYGLKSRMKFKIKKQGSLACVALDRVEGQFVAYPSIMIARNFPKGTCEYNAVLGHEKKHVRTLLNFQREYAPKFKSRLKTIVRRNKGPKIVSIAQIEYAQAQIQDDIMRGIEEYFGQIKPIVSARQKAIDSPQEYARVKKLCTRWDR